MYNSHTHLVIDEVDLMGPKSEEVVVKITATGLCHSDLHNINEGFARMEKGESARGAVVF